MSCTIDHLRADHRVEVIQDFMDARGVAHLAGESGILRRLQLDWPRREIRIEWEWAGRNEVLCFNLMASEGPRNGAMGEYFAVGEYSPARKPKSVATSSRRKGSPARPQPAARPAEFCLGDIRVECDCDPQLHRAVLVEPRSLHVTACLRCGTVTCTRCEGDDGRYHGNSWHAYWTVEVPPPVVDWLAQWPRVMVTCAEGRWPMNQELIRRAFLYYPPNLRVQNAAELARFEELTIREQTGKTAAERLRQLGGPETAPPAGMPAGLEGFVDIWETLRLRPDSDLLNLARKGQLLSQASHLAVDLLWQRPDAFEVMVGALRSEDEIWQSMGHAMAREARPGDQRLAAVIIEVLGRLSLDPLPDVPGRIVGCGRFEALLVLIADLKLATPEMLAALASWQRRLLRRDLWLAKYIRLVLQELKGEPPDASALYQGLSGIPIL